MSIEKGQTPPGLCYLQQLETHSVWSAVIIRQKIFETDYYKTIDI